MQAIYAKLNERESRGFTLIELLVVIAIIAVLAALILAALSSAQKGSRDSRRQSDLNQYKTALAQFAGDNGGAYTVGGAASTNVAQTGTGTQPYAGLSTNDQYMKSGNALVDPKNSGNFQYIFTSTTTDFGMCASMERDTSKGFAVGPTYSGGTGGTNQPAKDAAGTCAVKG